MSTIAVEDAKRQKQEFTVLKWTNDKQDPSWFNFPLDCFLIQNQLGENEMAEESKLVMFCAKESDLWRRTSYGFIRDSGHAYLGAELKQNRAIEIGFSVDSFKGQFDQGGILARVDEKNWVKAGVELSDGFLQLSVVTTRDDFSDWSTAMWPSEWADHKEVIIRMSRMGDALILRVKLAVENSQFRLLRVCPMPENVVVRAGPYSCAPTRDGLFVEFHRYVESEGESLH
jgi:regulation of enolase protein 1 (concanavalin A-like superfamily)